MSTSRRELGRGRRWRQRVGRGQRRGVGWACPIDDAAKSWYVQRVEIEPKGLPEAPPYGDSVIVHRSAVDQFTIIVMRFPVAATEGAMTRLTNATQIDAPVVACVTLPRAAALELARLVTELAGQGQGTESP